MADVPQHILILGSGVFGLTALDSLLDRPRFANTNFTLVSPTLLPSLHTQSQNSKRHRHDDTAAPTTSDAKDNNKTSFTSSVTASHDINRIIRSDYADPAYASLALEAQTLWRDPRAGWGAEGRYTESGLLLSANNTNKGEAASASAPSTAEYVTKALANAQALEIAAFASNPTPRRSASDRVRRMSNIHELNDAASIEAAMRAPAAAEGTGDTGYLNGGGGWADASASMEWLFNRIVAKGKADGKERVSYIRGTATRLLLAPATDGSEDAGRIAGARITTTATGEDQEVTADLTILATGAWTPALLSLNGIASPRGQCVLYLSLSDAEAAALRDIPVHLNLGSGCFVFPPTRTREDGGWETKIARHTYGYMGPVTKARPVRVDADGEAVHAVAKVRLPAFPERLPALEDDMLRAFYKTALPVLNKGQERERETRARVCWYLDTIHGDFIVGRHPAFRESLFVATGGSGHGFKFLPVLGRRIVDILEGVEDEETDEWRRRWAWPRPQEEEEVWCRDGSRAGELGLTLEKGLNNTRDEVKRKYKL